MLNRLSAMQSQLDDYRKSGGHGGERHRLSPCARPRRRSPPLLARGDALGKELGKLKDSVYDPKVQHKVMEDSLHQLSDLHDALEMDESVLAGLGVQAPTAPLLAIGAQLKGELDAKLAAYNALLSGDIAAYNQAAYRGGRTDARGGQADHRCRAAGDPLRVPRSWLAGTIRSSATLPRETVR